METFITWVLTLRDIGLIVLAIVAANKLRGKFPGHVEAHWTSAIIPSIGVVALHTCLYWIWPPFWVEWFNRPGFMVLQVVMIFGFYAASLATKQASVIGKILVLFAVIGIGINVYTIIFQLRDTYIAPVGSWSERIEVTRGSILRPERPVLIRVPDGRILGDNADGVMEPLLEATHVWVQSKDLAPVLVTVSR